MQPSDLIRKWGPGGPSHDLGERAGAQSHFIDLCRVLGVEEPGDPERYCFERGLTKTGSAAGRTDGFADVWLKGHFAWEYKAPGKSLDGALRQLMQYALPLESPPLLVVSDRLRIEVGLSVMPDGVRSAEVLFGSPWNLKSIAFDGGYLQPWDHDDDDPGYQGGQGGQGGPAGT